MSASHGLEERLSTLRRTFDDGFAVAPATTATSFEDFLAVTLGGAPFALRVRDITGLAVSRKIVPLPSQRPELLGVAGHRGSLIVVYGLAALLGYPATPAVPRWLALVGAAPETVGLAFDEFEGFLRVPRADIHAAPASIGAPLTAGEVLRVKAQSRRIVDLSSTLGALAVHAGEAGPRKES